MTKSLTDIQAELLGTFFEESFEGLQQLESGLLALNQSSSTDPDIVNDVFRAAHSIKGGAGSFGLVEVCTLGHAMESLLEDFRAQRAQPTRESLSALLEGVDLLRDALEARKHGSASPLPRLQSFCERLAELRGIGDAPSAPVAAAPACTNLRITFLPLPRILESGNEPVRLLRELSRLGQAQITTDLSKLPSLTEIDPSLCYLSWRIVLTGSGLTRESAEEVFCWVDTDAEVHIEADTDEAPVSAEPSPPGPPEFEATPRRPQPQEMRPAPVAASIGDTRGGASTMGSIRVGVDKIDMLMNMVGELVITQSMLGVMDDESRLDSRRLERLREGLGLLARNTRSLQESVMRLRSVPISVVFSRFPRLVHDLSQQLGKQVDLRITGQATEIDKTVVEKLGDPLVHLIRNSLDHGIETPEQRTAAGKHPVGMIEIAACHRGGDVVVEVTDDGRGIDRDKVIARARQLGLLGQNDAPPEDALRDFIFAPGFSTAAAVTDISGRGVGMDVVRNNIRALGGDVFVETNLGKGTRISMRLPLTLAIIDGQLIRVGKYTYVVPLLSIVESVQIEPKRITKYQGQRELYRLRDKLIPIVELGKVLGLATWTRNDDALMMVVETENSQIGLLVDELLAQQQVVVKSLETNYERVPGLSGATILGDGSVAFILDTAAIGRLVRGVSTSGAHAA